MTHRKDLVGECNDQSIPIGEMELQFCSRCKSPECSRSQWGKSRFEQRVWTWEDRLFNQVPTMDPSDPRSLAIGAQKFVSVSTGRVPEIRGWDAPGPVEPIIPTPQEVPVPLASKPIPGVLNTPSRQGQMLKGAPCVIREKADPWSAPPSVTPSNDKVIKPGAKIKLSGV